MSLPLVPLLQRQLETTLQLLISASPAMSADEIMLVRVRLNEAALVMGSVVVNRSNSTANGNPTYSTVDINLVFNVLDSRYTKSPFDRSYGGSSRLQHHHQQLWLQSRVCCPYLHEPPHRRSSHRPRGHSSSHHPEHYPCLRFY